VERWVVLMLGPVARENPRAEVERFVVLRLDPVANEKVTVPEERLLVETVFPVRVLVTKDDMVASLLYKVDTYKVLKVDSKGRNRGFCPLILLMVREEPNADSYRTCCVESWFVLILEPVAKENEVVPVERVWTDPAIPEKELIRKLETYSVETVREDTRIVLNVP